MELSAKEVAKFVQYLIGAKKEILAIASAGVSNPLDMVKIKADVDAFFAETVENFADSLTDKPHDDLNEQKLSCIRHIVRFGNENAKSFYLTETPEAATTTIGVSFPAIMTEISRVLEMADINDVIAEQVKVIQMSIAKQVVEKKQESENK